MIRGVKNLGRVGGEEIDEKDGWLGEGRTIIKPAIAGQETRGKGTKGSSQLTIKQSCLGAREMKKKTSGGNLNRRASARL